MLEQSNDTESNYVQNCRELVDLLLDLLNGLEDTDVDSQCDDDPIDDLETEPSLGWTDSEARRGQYADPWNVDGELARSIHESTVVLNV